MLYFVDAFVGTNLSKPLVQQEQLDNFFIRSLGYSASVMVSIHFFLHHLGFYKICWFRLGHLAVRGPNMASLRICEFWCQLSRSMHAQSFQLIKHLFLWMRSCPSYLVNNLSGLCISKPHSILLLQKPFVGMPSFFSILAAQSMIAFKNSLRHELPLEMHL